MTFARRFANRIAADTGTIERAASSSATISEDRVWRGAHGVTAAPKPVADGDDARVVATSPHSLPA